MMHISLLSLHDRVDVLAYRYNIKWTRTVQDAVLTVLLDGWLGGNVVPDGRVGRLLTLEEVGEQVFKGSFQAPTYC